MLPGIELWYDAIVKIQNRHIKKLLRTFYIYKNIDQFKNFEIIFNDDVINRNDSNLLSKEEINIKG